MATLTLRVPRTRQCQVSGRDWPDDHILNAGFPRRPAPERAFEFPALDNLPRMPFDGAQNCGIGSWAARVRVWQIPSRGRAHGWGARRRRVFKSLTLHFLAAYPFPRRSGREVKGDDACLRISPSCLMISTLPPP